MKILFVTPTWPDPANSGAKARMLSVLRSFKKQGAKVTLLHVDVNIGYPHASKEITSLTEEVIFQPFRSDKKLFRLKRFLFNLFLKYGPLWIYQQVALKNKKRKFETPNINRYRDVCVWNKLQELTKAKNFDIIWFNYAFWAFYPIEQLRVLKIVDTHDILHKRLEIAQKKNVFPRGIYATIEEEKYWLSKFDRVVAIQKNEAEQLRSLNAGHIYTIGHILKFSAKKKKTKKFTVGFIGSLNQVNLSTISYIENQVFKELGNKRSVFNFLVAGAVAHASNKADKCIYNLKNTEDFFENIDLLLNPVVEGTGLKIKNVEALAFGIPVITTQKGAEGIEDSEDVLIVRDDPAEIAFAILTVASDIELQERFKNSAEKYIGGYNLKQEIEIISCLSISKTLSEI